MQAAPTYTTVRTGPAGQEMRVPNVLPLLPISNFVVFPGTVMPLNVGRPRSKAAVDEVMPGEKLVGVIAQRQANLDEPQLADLHAVGVVCLILKLHKLNDGNQSIIVHGLARFRVKRMIGELPFPTAEIEILQDAEVSGPEIDALMSSVKQQAGRIVELSPNTPEGVHEVINAINSPSALADFLAANVNGDVADKQALLEEFNVPKRLQAVAGRLAAQLDMLELQAKIQGQVRASIDKNQRRYFLQEQLKEIRKELGEGDAEGNTEVDTLRAKLKDAGLPEAVQKEADRELGRLENVPQASPEYGVIRTYLQMLAELPWSKLSPDHIDLVASRQILDRDHHDLDKVKKRIVEYLAVRKLKLGVPTPTDSTKKSNAAGAILCFLGPPGVGKTSLGKSIAESMGRKFIRVALGGVRDESEIRGHRRTYIGSMPGRIISELRKAGTRNPVMMLDEIDKLGSDFRGDPASALLEVLDPAQNHSFTDHYLDVPFDLSQVLFIATANTMDTVPGPLRDRMEVIEIPGYTQADKLLIAKQYLVPRQLEANGLKRQHATFTDGALRKIIGSYTRESGVRNLERAIGTVCRGIAAEIVSATAKKVKVDEARVETALGPIRFESEIAQRTSVPGVATGLAYTPVGGEILFIEATRMAGKGGILLTGQIGEVMKESASAAFSLLRSRAEQLGLPAKIFSEVDVHVHVPAGAVPKDGPSAGVAMYTALASLFLNKPVKRDVAMTGEITLRGLVLPIGGLKEKTLAAKAAGIKTVIVPLRNKKDWPDLPDEVKKTMKFHFVENVDEALAIALDQPAAKRKT